MKNASRLIAKSTATRLRPYRTRARFMSAPPARVLAPRSRRSGQVQAAKEPRRRRESSQSSQKGVVAR